MSGMHCAGGYGFEGSAALDTGAARRTAPRAPELRLVEGGLGTAQPVRRSRVERSDAPLCEPVVLDATQQLGVLLAMAATTALVLGAWLACRLLA